MSPFVGEIIGTMVLIILGGGVVAGVVLNKSFANQGGWIVITFGWAMGVMLGIYAAGQISGAHLNPAVTIAFAAIGTFPWSDVPTYIAGQFIGAMLGATIVWLHYLPHWGQTEDKSAKLAIFCTAPAVPSFWANLLSEIIGTFFLIMALLFIGTNQFTEGLNPLIVGLLILAIGLSLGGTTGYAINPARDLGPRIMHFLLPIQGKGNSNWTYAPVPIIGSIIGGVLGSTMYVWLFEQKTSLLLWLSLGIALIVISLAIMQTSRKS